MSDLGSAPVPPPGPDDHGRGDPGAPLIIEYADYECPYCAALHETLKGLPLRQVFRHFPVASAHPRAWAAACAAEAAGRQGRFWAMHDLLFDDPSRLEDPHLWERARQLGLDLSRFDSDRRSELVRQRIKDSFRSGIRAGVATTPTLFTDHGMVAGSECRTAVGRLFGGLGR